MAAVLHGIDIHHVRHPAGWSAGKTVSALYAAGPAVRMLCHKATEGRGFVDPKFADTWKAMRDQGVKYRGAYHVIRFNEGTLVNAEQQAHKFLDVVTAAGGKMLPGEFVQLDWEGWGRDGQEWATLDQVSRWMEVVEAAIGKRVVPYYGFYCPWRNDPRLFNHDLWFPMYSDRVRYNAYAAQMSPTPTIWQWGGGGGGVDVAGIGRVDSNEVIDWGSLNVLAGYPGGGGGGDPNPIVTVTVNKPVIEAFDVGLQVAEWQAILLHKAGQLTVQVTGVFDGATHKATINLQRVFKLPETGVVDAATWTAGLSIG